MGADDGASPPWEEWTSSGGHPAARYLYARDISGAAPDELEALRAGVLDWEPLNRILGLQLVDGGFPSHGKQPTVASTLTALRLMALCGMDLRDEPVSRALSFVEQGYCADGAISYRLGGSGILPCYVGLTTRALVTMGALDSLAVRASLEWIVRHQRYDHRGGRAGGDEPWPYRSVVNYGCWQSVSCYHGVVATLGALTAVPEPDRTSGQRARIGEAIAYLRPHRVYKRTTGDAPIFRTSTQFSLFHPYRPHLLDVLEWLADAAPSLVGEPWVREAISDVEALTIGGRIPLVANGTTHLVDPLPLEPIGEPSRLLTLQWMRLRLRFGLAH